MRRGVVAIGLAAVLGAAAGAALVSAASAVTVPLEADFGVMMPGASAESETSLSVPVSSVVTAAEWSTVTGAGVWGARLCGAATCTDLDELVGTAIDAGSYRVVVDVTMPMDAAGTGPTAASGRISLMESSLPLSDGGALAVTGAALPWVAMLAGAAALGGGTALLVRRRRPEDEERVS